MRTEAIRLCVGSVVALSLMLGAYAAELPKDAQQQNPKTADGKKAVWTLSTGDTRMTIGVDSSDQLAIYELINPANNWNWTGAASVIPLPTRIEIREAVKTLENGALPALAVGDLISATGEKKDLTNPATWTFQKGTKTSANNGETVTLLFTCTQLPALYIESVWWAASPNLPGPVQHTFRLINESTRDVALNMIPALSFAIQPPSGYDVSLWTFGDAGDANTEGRGIKKHHIGSMPEGLDKEADAEKAQVEIAGKGGALGQEMPFVLLDDRGVCGVYLGMEERMHFVFQIKTRQTAPSFCMKALYRPGNNILVAARQTVTIQPTYLGVYTGDIDDGCNQFKRWFWNNKTPANHRNDSKTPWLQYGGMWTYQESAASKQELWWSDEKTFRKGIEKEGLAEIGFECAEVDAHWDKAERAGDWPSGTKIMAPLAHANGLKFNLYLMNYITWESREKLAQYWKDYQIDMWRNDFQMAGLDVQAWAQENCPKHYKFEYCNASPDFHTMTYASLTDLWEEHEIWRLRKQFYTLSYTIPPGQISAMIPIQVAGDGDKDRFNVWHRSTLLSGAWLGVGAIGPNYNPKNIVFPSDVPHVIPCLKSNLAIYKSKIRPLIREGNLYHDIVDAASGFDGAEYYSPAEDRGVVMLFGPSGKSTTVRCKRLKPEQKYQVQFTDQPAQNTALTGAQLMKEGLPVTFTGTIQSEIILIGK